MSGGQQRDATTVQTSEPWSAQRPYLEDLFQRAQGYYEGDRPDLQAGRELAQAGVGRLREAADTVQPLVNDAQAANRRLISGEFLSPDSNPALMQYIDQTNALIKNQFTEGILPQLQSGAAAAGNIGSSRAAIAEGLASGKVIDAMQRNASAQANAAYGQGLRAYVGGLALTPQTAALQGVPAGFFNEAGNQQIQVDSLQQQQELSYLQQYRDLVGGQQFGGTVATTGPGVRTGGMAGALGGAAMGAGIGYQIGGGAGAAGAGTGAAWGAGAGAIAGYFS